MMEHQFQKMSADDKKRMMETMMDKFFSTMSDDEKKEMMSGMMPKMMGQMMGNNPTICVTKCPEGPPKFTHATRWPVCSNSSNPDLK